MGVWTKCRRTMQGTTPTETLSEIVNELSEGDELELHAWECRVDEAVENEVRSYLTVKKKSVGGYMATEYRIDHANPANEDDQTLVMKADRKHGWDVEFYIDPSKIDY